MVDTLNHEDPQGSTAIASPSLVSSQPFRLLDLPQELRNCIYKFALTSEHGLKATMQVIRPTKTYKSIEARADEVGDFNGDWELSRLYWGWFCANDLENGVEEYEDEVYGDGDSDDDDDAALTVARLNLYELRVDGSQGRT